MINEDPYTPKEEYIIEDFDFITLEDYLNWFGINQFYVDSKTIGLSGFLAYEEMKIHHPLYYILDNYHEKGLENINIAYWISFEYSSSGILDNFALYLELNCNLNFNDNTNGQLNITNGPLSISFSSTLNRDGTLLAPPSKNEIESAALGEAANEDNRHLVDERGISSFSVEIVCILGLMTITGILTKLKRNKKFDKK